MENDSNTRLTAIRANLKRDDIKEIAMRAGVYRVWVSYVLNGRGTSEPVLRIAEELIKERKITKNT